ncbi:MAG: hypothetical protein AT709_03390 [Caldivirga sp. MG_3]|nr:MAG: hypothetical protein AT709_03390 [Caldivirga sp. MG_3]
MKGMPNQGSTIGLYLLLTTLLFLSVNGHVVLGEINTNMPLNMPTCPLNSSIVLMLTPEPILPSKNMIVTYGPPGPWTIIEYNGAEYLLQINMWNLASVGYGNETLTFNNATGEVCFSAYISNVTLINPSGGVWGYPGLYLVGIFPGGQVNVRNPMLPLPLTVSDLVNGTYSNRLLVLNYTMWVPDDEPMDWSYDIWLTTTPAPSASLNHGAELMIWLYTTTPVFPWADTGIKVNVPIIVNGTVVNETFDIHVDCYHGYDNTYWTYIAFVPLNGGFSNALVSISLKPFLQYMVNVFPRVCPSLWNSPNQVAGLYMDTITLGSEFGSTQWATEPGWGAIAWKLYEASVVVPGVAYTTSTVTVTATATMVKYTTITETSPVTVTTTTSLVRYVTSTSTVTIIKQAINENYALGALIIVIIISVVLVLIHR